MVNRLGRDFFCLNRSSLCPYTMLAVWKSQMFLVCLSAEGLFFMPSGILISILEDQGHFVTVDEIWMTINI